MIDLNLIYTFLDVARTGNLNVAARKLYITPSALSQRIKALEDHIGKSLFLRRRTGMELNSSGREFHEICMSLEKDAIRIDNWIATQKGNVGGEIIIASISGMPGYIFPDFLGKFLKIHPDISITVEDCGISARVEEVILAGKADVGLIVGECQKPSLVMRKIFVNNNVLMVCSPDYHLAKKRKITPKDLSDAQIIWHAGKDSRTAKKISSQLGLGRLSAKGFLRLPSMDVCRDFALKGLGIAFVAKLYIFDELKSGKLVAIPGLNLNRPGYLISRNEKYEPPAVTRFKDEFAKYCSELDRRWGELKI